MKKLLYLLTATLLFVAGCNKGPEAEINISGSPSISIGDNATGGSFTFTANHDWTIEPQDNWVHVNPVSGKASDQSVTVSVTCDPNPDSEPRTSKIIISAGGVKKEITVTQQAGTIPVTGISINPSEAIMRVGETLQLTATVFPSNATDKTVTWEKGYTINVSVITVSSDGLVTATDVGSCEVTAKCGNLTASCTITVKPSSFTIYAYDGLDWGSMKFYGWDDDQEEVNNWFELDPVGVEEVYGHSFYKFEVASEWSDVNFAFCFSDSAGDKWTVDYNGWFEPGKKYYLHITGPYDEDGDASIEYISQVSSFDPQPYVPPGTDIELPEGTLFYAGFDSDDALEGWTFMDTDNDGYGWCLASEIMGIGYGRNGSRNTLVSQSYNHDTGALTPDNWAFTPAITLASSNNQLSLWICGQDELYAAEHIAVYMTEQIPSGGDIASGCTLLMEGTYGSEFVIFTKTQAEWLKYEIPLPDEFNGKTVYFGFRHFDVTDQFVVNIDDIIVTRGVE